MQAPRGRGLWHDRGTSVALIRLRFRSDVTTDVYCTGHGRPWTGMTVVLVDMDPFS